MVEMFLFPSHFLSRKFHLGLIRCGHNDEGRVWHAKTTSFKAHTAQVSPFLGKGGACVSFAHRAGYGCFADHQPGGLAGLALEKSF